MKKKIHKCKASTRDCASLKRNFETFFEYILLVKDTNPK